LHEEHIIQKHLGWFEVCQMEAAARPGGWGYGYHDISVLAHVAVRVSLDNLLDRRARVQLLASHVEMRVFGKERLCEDAVGSSPDNGFWSHGPAGGGVVCPGMSSPAAPRFVD
jgi:hypothetical protein